MSEESTTAKPAARPRLPKGLSPKEEAEWWDRHRDYWFSGDDEFEVTPPTPVRRTAPVRLRLPIDLLDALKEEANEQGTSHEWLIRTWLEERLTAEAEARSLKREAKRNTRRQEVG